MVFCSNEICSGICPFDIQSFNPPDAFVLVCFFQYNRALAEFIVPTDIIFFTVKKHDVLPN